MLSMASSVEDGIGDHDAACKSTSSVLQSGVCDRAAYDPAPARLLRSVYGAARMCTSDILQSGDHTHGIHQHIRLDMANADAGIHIIGR